MLQDLHRQLDAIRLEMSNGYRELARLRLDDLQAGQVIAHLNETDQMLFTLVQNLKRTRLNLKEQIEASLYPPTTARIAKKRAGTAAGRGR